MAPSAVLTEEVVTQTDPCDSTPPRKRIKLQHGHEDLDAEDGTAVASHPLGVKPLGNALTAALNLKENAGLFARLPDEVLQVLLESLDAGALLRIGHTCRYLFAFTSLDEFWRSLFVTSAPEDFQWRSSWRSTYLHFPSTYTPRFDCDHVFSDVLHRPFFCSVVPLAAYAANIPHENIIPRVATLNLDEFNESWTNKPFILTSPVKQWPAYKHWTKDALLQKHRHVKFRAEAVDWPLETYFDYMHNSHDESPLYLFDRDFAAKMGTTYHKNSPAAEYWPPECFEEDLFSALGDQRPDCRWLIVGPERSGSTFHKDPNGTSAWNAVLTGSKYWLMFPSSANIPPPPGIILSSDQSEITSPLSIAEYLLSFHEIARATPGCHEGVCHAGEVLHVPSGWFHLVLNLDESIAVTQNFVPRKKLADVMRFLRDSPDQVSGFKDDVQDPFALFVERLREHYPELLEQALQKLDGADSGRKGRWEELTKGHEVDGAEAPGFSFAFSDSEGEE